MLVNETLTWRLSRDVDVALASDDGLLVAEMASRHGVSVKAINRTLALLRSTGRETVISKPGPREYRHHWAAGVTPVFVDTITKRT